METGKKTPGKLDEVDRGICLKILILALTLISGEKMSKLLLCCTCCFLPSHPPPSGLGRVAFLSFYVIFSIFTLLERGNKYVLGGHKMFGHLVGVGKIFSPEEKQIQVVIKMMTLC